MYSFIYLLKRNPQLWGEEHSPAVKFFFVFVIFFFSYPCWFWSNLSTVIKNLGKSSSPHAHCGQSVYVLVKYEIPYLQRSGKRKEKKYLQLSQISLYFLNVFWKKGSYLPLICKRKKKVYILWVFCFPLSKKFVHCIFVTNYYCFSWVPWG